MARTGKLKIGGVLIEDVKMLEYTDRVPSIGRWSAELERIYKLTGFATINILRDDMEVFRGRLEEPSDDISPSGIGMSVGGPEWTARLKDYLTPHSSQSNAQLTTALQTILQESPFGLGDVDNPYSQADPFIWDTALEFLAFEIFSNLCIVSTTTEEITDELDVGDFEVPPPCRRWVFYSHASHYFYFVLYDDANNLLKYNSTNDFETWKGWTSLGFNKGDNGNYGIWWDEANGNLHLLCDDGANIDYYRYTEAAGTLTQHTIKKTSAPETSF